MPRATSQHYAIILHLHYRVMPALLPLRVTSGGRYAVELLAVEADSATRANALRLCQ
ncbi:hypothetical protein D3C78_1470970 [compost metagenome]